MKTVLLFLFTLTFSTILKGQARRYTAKEIEQMPIVVHEPSYPVVRDTFNRYPNSILVEGIIEDVTAGMGCGFYCSAGTIKVKILKQIKQYPYTYAFIVIPCFSVKVEDYLDKTVRIRVIKLLLSNTECYWLNPINHIDSKGLPFYRTPENSGFGL